MKTIPMRTITLYRCSCRGHGISVSVDADDPTDTRDIWLEFWVLGERGGDGWWRNVWRAMRGQAGITEVILDQETARAFAWAILRAGHRAGHGEGK